MDSVHLQTFIGEGGSQLLKHCGHSCLEIYNCVRAANAEDRAAGPILVVFEAGLEGDVFVMEAGLQGYQSGWPS